MPSDLKPRSIKISDAMWERWRSQAKAIGISVTAMIVERTENPRPPPIAGVIPIAGTEFPRRPVQQRKEKNKRVAEQD